MNTNFNQQGSAKIYQFPVGGRSALAARQDVVKTTVDMSSPRVNEAVCSGSWYHEEAIRDAQSPTKPWER
jgi:hypothetical protein